MDNKTISIVLPAKNEAAAIGAVVSELRSLYANAEIIVVDDGSDDATAECAREAGALVVSHPYSQGNGAAIKTGARHASGDTICFMDADGQHRPADIARLLEQIDAGFDMAVGARTQASQASFLRSIGNGFYNWFASLIVGQKIEDLTSGMRAVKADKFRQFLHLLPNKFSYPTTITMAFFRSGYPVAYVPIVAEQRTGKSHLNIVSDGIRFLIIIVKVGTLYSPLKVFIPVATLQFLAGFLYYLYTFFESGRFTNMSALMLTSSLTIFLIGIVSEQITTLIYQTAESNKE